MSIDLSTISSVLNNVQNQANTSKVNNYSINFAEYLLNATTSKSNRTTIGDDIASASQLNINDPAALQSAIQKLLNSGSYDISSLLDQNATYSNKNDSLTSIYSLFNDMNGKTSNSNYFESMYGNYNSSNALVDAFQSNFLSKQMNVMQTAYNKLQNNLEQYKIRNANNDSAAVQARIAEMTKNVTTIQTYMQEKLAEKATNENLLNQLNAKGQIARLPFK